ncbi:hypothetical protein [Acidovorax temperans]|uniref:hypothetical protein n=1 Tax=Acidovorax temperans TaxID=80878 RepID=UPI0035AF85E3
MRLQEIDGSDAASQRVKALKYEAKRAKDRAKQVKARADMAAASLLAQKACKQAAMARQASSTSMIQSIG